MTFWTLPPEINSTLIYTGPGSSPLITAAGAWSKLAADLRSSAEICEGVIRQLTGEAWLGTASASMAAAVAPYLAWIKTTAEQAEIAATQARAAAGAYETAHGLTVPPTAVLTNRVELQQLVATNILGQNTGAIAVNETEHGEMWEQDVLAMQGYHAQTASATKLAQFTAPPNPTDPSGQGAQGAAVSKAAADSGTSNVQNVLTNLLSGKAADGSPITNPLDDVLKDPGYQLGNNALSQITSQANLQSNNVCAVWRGVSGVLGLQKLFADGAKAAAPAAQGAANAAQGAAQGAANAAQGAAGGLGAVSGSMGRAGALGGLGMAVPPAWAPPAPPVTPLGPVSGGTWQPVGPGILGNTPMAPPAGLPGVPGAAAAHGAGMRGFGAPRYGVAPTVMPKTVIGG